MVEVLVKRVKDIRKEEEASEGASNDAVVASLRRSVGGHARIGVSDSDSPEQKKKYSGEKRLHKNYCYFRRTSFWCRSLETSYARGLEANS